MARTPASELADIAAASVDLVEFYKIDELTTDLICCDIKADGRRWFFHEEGEGWDALIEQLALLPGFRVDWLGHVSQPPFAECRFVAYEQSDG
jgi:hypothetical protein